MTEFAFANIGVASYLIGGVGFLVLTLFLLVGWRGRGHGVVLTLACALNALWCFVIVVGLLQQVGIGLIVLVEVLRDGAWLFFVACMMADGGSRRTGLLLRGSTVVAPAALAVFVVWRMGVATLPGMQSNLLIFVVAAMAMALWALIMLEQLFRNAGPDRRWGLKYICLAVATLFVYEFFMYSYSLLGQHVPLPLWNARGAVNALVVPLIAVAAARNRSWAIEMHVSRQVVFHTGTLIGCGGYLLVVAIGGYFVRQLGGSWGQFLGVLFFTAALLVLIVMLLSAQFRSRIKVLINKHFFSYKYDYRDEWLSLTRRLNEHEGAHDPYQRAIMAVADVMDSPAAALWLARDDRYVCVASWNMLQADSAADPAESLVAFLREYHWIVDLQQYAREPTHYVGLSLPEWLYDVPRARLIIPLLEEDQSLLGFVLLATPRSQYHLTWEDFDLLKTVGRQVGGFLSQQENNLALTQARQFEAFNRMTAYLMHDLKNIMAQQSLIVKNAQKHKNNPEFVEDMVATVDSSVARMKSLLQQLQNPGADQDKQRRVDALRLLRNTLDNLRHGQPQPQLRTDGIDAAFVTVDASRFGAVLGHVIRNAQDAAGADGHVEVVVELSASEVTIQVIDDGAGMAPEFVRNYLFRPFYSTKSSRGMGIGAFQAREFARAAGGRVTVASEPGQGTVFSIILPQAADPAMAMAADVAREVRA